MGIVSILAPLMALIVWIAKRAMESNRRLNDREFIVACIALIPVVAWLALSFWDTWVDHCAEAGMRPFPEISYRLYSQWELTLSPVLVTVLIYAGLVFLLTLAHWPEGLTKEEVKGWQRIKLRQAFWVLVLILVLDLGYVAFRWYPVWGQWF